MTNQWPLPDWLPDFFQIGSQIDAYWNTLLSSFLRVFGSFVVDESCFVSWMDPMINQPQHPKSFPSRYVLPVGYHVTGLTDLTNLLSLNPNHSSVLNIQGRSKPRCSFLYATALSTTGCFASLDSWHTHALLDSPSARDAIGTSCVARETLPAANHCQSPELLNRSQCPNDGRRCSRLSSLTSCEILSIYCNRRAGIQLTSFSWTLGDSRRPAAP